MSKPKFQRQLNKITFLLQIGWIEICRTPDFVFLSLADRVCSVSKFGTVLEMRPTQAAEILSK